MTSKEDMKTVTRREALKGLSRFLRDMYTWCDVNGEYKGTVSVSKGTVKRMRRLVDSVLEADASGADVRIIGDDVVADLRGES